jgi:hypothetical protein
MAKPTPLAVLVCLVLPASAAANHPVPAGLTVTDTTMSGVFLDWENYTRFTPREYRIRLYALPGDTLLDTRISPNSDTWWNGAPPGPGHLNPDSPYRFRLQAVAAGGHLSSSAVVDARTKPTAPPPSEWTFCANENQRCSFTGTREVRYGTNGTFTAPRQFRDGVDCNNNVFGDPVVGFGKHCDTRPANNPPPPKQRLSSAGAPHSHELSVRSVLRLARQQLQRRRLQPRRGFGAGFGGLAGRVCAHRNELGGIRPRCEDNYPFRRVCRPAPR